MKKKKISSLLVDVTCLFILVCFLCSYADGSREVTYIGCMKRSDGSKAFNTRVRHRRFLTRKPAEMMTIQWCIKECWNQRHKMAGLQKGSICYCSPNTKDMVKVPEEDCDNRCTGNCYQACGGDNVVSVYQTGYIREPAFAMDKKPLLKAHIGCYNRLSARRILCPSGFSPLKTLRMSVPMCVYYCDAMYKAKFATTAGMDQCCCSNSVTGAENTRLSYCDKPCTGDPNMGCIGTHRGIQWATFQISLLPKFTRWPRSTFEDATWMEPHFQEGEKFEISKKIVQAGAADASLSGLLAKKMARQRQEGPSEVLVEKDNVPSRRVDENKGMIGEDKREPVTESVGQSVAVVEVPEKAARMPTPEEDKSNGAIIAAVVIGFVILIASFGFYMFRRKKLLEEKKAGGEEKKGTGDETESEDEKRKRRERRKRKKKKKKKKEKEEAEGTEGGGEGGDTTDDAEASLM